MRPGGMEAEQVGLPKVRQREETRERRNDGQLPAGGTAPYGLGLQNEPRTGEKREQPLRREWQFSKCLRLGCQTHSDFQRARDPLLYPA